MFKLFQEGKLQNFYSDDANLQQMTICRQPKTPKNYFFKLLFLMNLTSLKVLYKKTNNDKEQPPSEGKKKHLSG